MTSVIIKTKKEISIMREAGKRHAELMHTLVAQSQIGISTMDLENTALKTCNKLKVTPMQIGYKGYKHAICAGINDDGLHCIPSNKKILSDGDILTLDSVIGWNGLCVDGGLTIGIGDVDREGTRLIEVGKMALDTAIKTAKVGNHTGDIGNAIYTIASLSGFDTVKEYAAHGVGKKMHEEPNIPNFGEPGSGEVLEEGTTIAMDILITEGKSDLITLEDGWSTRTKDGKRFVFFEHTIVITRDGAEILTQF